MPGRECHHCKQWVERGEPHDCWTTTEGALTEGLPEDLQEAYARLRETAAEFGEQRIYASHNSIMFARKACYFFVRPKQRFLEVCVFLGRTIEAPQVRKTMAVSKVKVAHLIRIQHRDEVEPPITDWLREAYDLQTAAGPSRASSRGTGGAKGRPRAGADLDQPIAISPAAAGRRPSPRRSERAGGRRR
ncbi:MAG TPA: DUF5655 domain-containing protein [Vicinamibacterales bacterium]|nr:DUF5655 domain-containing protein [Vicinamibacterales bacterium]